MIAIREIIATTALNFGFEPVELVSGTRAQGPTLARQVAMYIARKTTSFSTPVIARAFGDRDHTSVLHAIKKIEAGMENDPALKAAVASLIATMEFREKVESFGDIDVIAVARRIAMRPQRHAMDASVMEVAALAATVLDLWEIATAAEMLAEQMDVPFFSGDDAADQDRDALISALARTIREEMAALRGETNTETDTNIPEIDDGSRHS